MTIAIDPFDGGQAEGAISNGTRIRKVRMEAGDINPVGAEGVVVSSVDTSEVEIEGIDHEDYGYMVKWDDFDPPVFVVGSKIEEV